MSSASATSHDEGITMQDDQKERRVSGVVESAMYASIHFLARAWLQQIQVYLAFVMGMAWKSFITIAVLESPFMVDVADSADAVTLWLVFLCISAALVPCIVLLNWRRAVLQRLAKDDMEQGRQVQFLAKTARDKSYANINDWALVWVVVTQLDTAIIASVPSENPALRLIAFLATLFLFVVPIAVLRAMFRESGEEHNVWTNLTDTLVAGSGFAYALSFLAVLEAIAGADHMSSSDDVVRMCIYSFVVILISSAILALICLVDEAAAQKKLVALRDLREEDASFSRLATWCVCGSTAATMRELLLPCLSLATASTFYNLLHLMTLRITLNYEPVSVRQPLEPWPAFFFMLLCLVGGSFAALLIKWLSARAITALMAITQTGKDVMSSTLVQVMGRNMIAGSIVASAWVVGMSIHMFGMAVLWELFGKQEDTSWDTKIAVYCVYAVTWSVVVAIFTVYISVAPANAPARSDTE